MSEREELCRHLNVVPTGNGWGTCADCGMDGFPVCECHLGDECEECKVKRLQPYDPKTHRLIPNDGSVVVLDGIVGSLSVVAGGFRTEDGHQVRWRIERAGERFGWGAQIDDHTKNPTTDELVGTFDEAKSECFEYVREFLGLRSRIEELEGALRTIERSALSGYVKNVASRALARQGAEPVEGGDDGE